MMFRTAGLLASIPSPSSGTLNIGPLKIHAYGLMIALGIVAGVWLMGRRFEKRGIGTRDDANSIAVWAVIAGVIGARLYHVATDWSKFENHLSNIPKLWQGGLGIPGGLLAGIGVGIWMIRRKGMPVAVALDCAAPALPLAQAIGRVGNYFNQELFGRPTTLPWALRIDVGKIPLGYAPGTTFHPTFLYESLSNLVLCGLLILIGGRFRLRPGHLLATYFIGYGIIRFWVEGLRIDEAHHVGGLRWNQWVALVAVVGGVAYLLISRARGGEGGPATESGESIDADESTESGESTEPVGLIDAGDAGHAGDAGVTTKPHNAVDSGDHTREQLPSGT